MIRCTTIDITPSPMCYEICVLARKCGALKAWESERDNYKMTKEQMEHDILYKPTYNPEDGSM